MFTANDVKVSIIFLRAMIRNLNQKSKKMSNITRKLSNLPKFVKDKKPSVLAVRSQALSMFFSVAIFFLMIGCVNLPHKPSEKGVAERTYPKVIVVILDALKHGTLMNSLDLLPNFKEIIAGKNSDYPYVYFENVLGSIPSSSMPANTTLLTGVYPRRHGVPSTVWFDREKEQVITLTSFLQRRIINFLEQTGTDTIFDYARRSNKTTMAVATQVAKGVESPNWIKQSVHLWAQAFCLNLLQDGNPIPDGAHLDRGTTKGLMDGHLYSLTDGLRGTLRAKGDIPDVTVVHYVGLDIFTHYPRQFMAENNWTVDQIQRWYLGKVLDPEIGKIQSFLKENSLFGNVVFFFVSDHGQTKIEKYIVEKDFLEGFPESLNIAGRHCSMSKANVVVMPGASTKAIYVKNQLKRQWLFPPRLLEDVKPVVDASVSSNGMDKYVNTLIVAKYPGERDRICEKSDEFWYFDLKTYLNSDRDHDDFLAALRPFSSLDRHVGQHLKASKMYNLDFRRTNKPDIVLINKPGYYFTPDEGKYAHHGSIYPKDAFVSFVISGPKVGLFSSRPQKVVRQIDTVDLVPMIAYLASIKIDRPIDGKNRLVEIR